MLLKLTESCIQVVMQFINIYHENDAPIDLNGQIIYHCGPVMIKMKMAVWHVKAAGPTTRIREEPYQGDIMKKFGIRAVIGKGGMGPKTLAALTRTWRRLLECNRWRGTILCRMH